MQTRPYRVGGSAAVEEAMRTAAAAREIDLSALGGEELRRSFRSLRLDSAGADGRREMALGAAVVSEALARGLAEGGGPRFRVTDEQVAAGLLMYGGVVVEMGAGEGKTVAGAFPAAFHALTGGGVHVVTANDYLAARDAELLSSTYGALGLEVGAVLGPMTDPERATAYSRSVVYGTLREFGFDYLRDNLRLPPDPPVQGALYAAVVDEADQVLLDQARTPLVISGGPSGTTRGLGRARRAMEEMVAEQRGVVGELEERLRDPGLSAERRDGLLARLLCADHDGDTARGLFAAEDGAYERVAGIVTDSDLSDPEGEIVRGLYFVVDTRRGAVALTEAGRSFLERRTGYGFDTGGLQRRLDELERDADTPLADLRPLVAKLSRRIARRHGQANQITQLLRAYTLLRRDVHYLVSEGHIVLIDQETGRTLPDSRYRFGIHAALEAKEGLRVRDEPKTLAQISVRGFVARYERVCGMTGTARGGERELMSQFGLDVQVVAPSNPQRRSELGPRLYASRADKLAAVADEAAFWHGVGRPVLVGAPTIEESEEVSRRLGERGVAHSLLNAASQRRRGGDCPPRGALWRGDGGDEHGGPGRGHRGGAGRERAGDGGVRSPGGADGRRGRGPRGGAVRQRGGRRGAGRGAGPRGRDVGAPGGRAGHRRGRRRGPGGGAGVRAGSVRHRDGAEHHHQDRQAADRPHGAAGRAGRVAVHAVPRRPAAGVRRRRVRRRGGGRRGRAGGPGAGGGRARGEEAVRGAGTGGARRRGGAGGDARVRPHPGGPGARLLRGAARGVGGERLSVALWGAGARVRGRYGGEVAARRGRVRLPAGLRARVRGAGSGLRRGRGPPGGAGACGAGRSGLASCWRGGWRCGCVRWTARRRNGCSRYGTCRRRTSCGESTWTTASSSWSG